VEAEPAFEHAGKTLNAWTHLTRDPVFNFSPSAGDLGSWFFPAWNGFVDSRFRGTAEELMDYVAIRKGLMGLDHFGPDGKQIDWRAALRKHHTRLIVVFNRDMRQTWAVMSQLLTRSNEWPLLYLKGPILIFGWRDRHRPESSDPFAGLEIDWNKRAFGREKTDQAPLSGWQDEPQPFHWWQGFWKDRLVRSDDFDEAQLWLHCFDTQKAAYAKRNAQRWNGSLYAGLVASRILPAAGPLEGYWRIVSTPTARNLFYLGSDDGPRAPLFLALRATRRALVKKHVQDARAFFLLGEIYSRLGNTREKLWTEHFPRFGRMRTVQAVAAYQYAVRLQPDLVEAHSRLVGHFDAMGFKDLALKHRKEVLKYLRRQQARLPHGTQLAGQLTQLKKIVYDQEQDLENVKKDFEINSVNLKAVDRARLAGRMGLAGMALEILLESDVAGFGTRGMDLELKLLLITGQTEKVRLWMEPRQEELLDAYHWNKLQLAAAIGNYADADGELDFLAKIRGLEKNSQLLFRSAIGFMLGSSLLTEAAGGFYQKIPLRLLVPLGRVPVQVAMLLPDKQTAPGIMISALKGMDQEAEYLVLRGLLALEAGRIGRAKDCFQKALAFWDSPAGAAFVSQTSGTPRNIARHCLDVVTANSAGP
jgi:tetratricopeptide (TPR) repeat protein